MKKFISLLLIVLITISTLSVMTAGAVEVPKVSIDGNNSVTKTYGDKAFNLGLTVNADNADVLKPKLTYTSANEKIAKVSAGGKVTLKGCGKTTITAKASMLNPYSFFAGEKYISVQKKVTLTVKPAKVVIKKTKSYNKKLKRDVIYLNIQNKQINCDKYIIHISSDKHFKKNNRGENTYKNNISKIMLKPPKGKKFFARVKAIKKIDGKTYGDWSNIIPYGV